jgi:hypothetical protein
MFNRFKLLYSPDDNPAGNANLPMGKEDTITFLGMEDEKEQVIPLDEKKPVEKEKEEVKEPKKDVDEVKDKEGEEEEEEIDELKEIEESLEEDEIDEEKLELVNTVSRKEILKKYPILFKDFPYLEHAFYRNYQFTEYFSTPNEAKEALAKAETLDAFDKDLLSGNTKNILEAAKKSDPKAFYKIVDNYMATLADVDEKAYHHVLGNNIKQTIVAMVKEGRRGDNETLVNAAAILNQFVFGSSEFEPAKNLSSGEDNKDDSREKQLEKEKQDFILQRLETANTELSRTVQNSLKATIAANLDPKNSMSEFVKKHASAEVLQTIESSLQNDKQFQVLVDRLWEKALESNFTKDSTDRIRNAFFAKAKMLLPAAIKKARIEALRGMGKRVKEEAEEKEEPVEKSGDDRPERKRSSGKTGEIPAGMSTLEFLMKD